MRLSAALAALALGLLACGPLLACSKKESPPPAGSGTVGSAAGSAAGSGAGSNDPWSKPAAPANAAPCDDAEIRKHIDASLKVSLTYLTALEAKTKKWNTSCDVAMKDLIALEPDAKKFMDEMLAFKAWGETLSEACRTRVGELGEAMDATRDIENRTPGLEAKVRPILETCKDHAGFADAAAKGLRVMHRKRGP